MASKKGRKKAKKKAQIKRRKGREKEVQREPDVHVNHTLPDLPNLVAPNYNVVSDKTVAFDHDKAYEYCDLPIFEGERNVVEDHVQVLYDKMRRKTFNWRLVILSSAMFKGVTYKINGQHTAWALVNLTVKEVANLYGAVKVREIVYRIESLSDMKAVYGMYDAHLGRTDGHLTKVQLVNEDAVSGIQSTLLSPLVSGLKFWLFERKHERARYRAEESTALVFKHNVTFRLVAAMLQDNRDNIKLLKRQAVTAAMFSTFDKVPTLAKGFWQPVADGLGLGSKNDPRYKLRSLLQESSLHVSRGALNQKSLAAEDMYRVSISAWNKWRKDEDARATLRPTKRRQPPV